MLIILLIYLLRPIHCEPILYIDDQGGSYSEVFNTYGQKFYSNELDDCENVDYSSGFMFNDGQYACLSDKSTPLSDQDTDWKPYTQTKPSNSCSIFTSTESEVMNYENITFIKITNGSKVLYAK